MARVSRNSLMFGTSGVINRQIVFKQYRYGTVASAFPDMSGVKYNRKQKSEQGLFGKAVAYAQAIVHDDEKKKEYAKKLPKGKQVYNAAIQEYLEKHKLPK